MSRKQKGTGKRSTDSPANTNGNLKKPKHAYDFRMSDKIQEKLFIKNLKEYWLSEKKSDYETKNNVKLIKDPFNCLILKNVISNDFLLDDLKEELQNQSFVTKNNDLYKFVQSTDLKGKQGTAIKGLKEFLGKELKPWLEEVTEITLNETIDLFCAKYECGDYLLCHDDELEGRRIAYIMYFVPEWKMEDGGHLDLFDRDNNGCPKTIVKSLVPTFNSIVCFEVTPKSFHQVAEIISKDKSRLSVGGWFHGKSPARPAKYIEKPLILQPPMSITEDEFYTWINPQYLDPVTQSEIQTQFETNSEISLPNFLHPEKYCMINAAFKEVSKTSKVWDHKGPANKRCIDILSKRDDSDSLESLKVIQSCIDFLSSDAVFLLLSNLTGLNLHPMAMVDEDDATGEEVMNDNANHNDQDLANNKNKIEYESYDPSATSSKEDSSLNEDSTVKCHSKCKTTARRWRQGCYTLLHDNDVELEQQKSQGKGYSLDARLFFNCENWRLECGGYTSYIAKDEDEELLTASPEDNTLTIVYKDNETLSFIKYVTNEINDHLSSGEFHDIAVTYYE